MTAYLMIVQGMRGLGEPQVWYADDGQFVGAAVTVLEKTELPDRAEPWSIEQALRWVWENT